VPTILEGLRVVDLTHGQPGALATMILADNGATVTRVEGSGPKYRGDPSRSVPGYRQWHRGKHVERLDLKSTLGRDRALALIAEADVLVEAFRPGVLERLGMGWDVQRSLNSRLISCSISAFGPKGPYSGIAGYEAIVHAVAGKMTEFGASRGRPSYVAVPFLSFATSQSALHGILCALLVRQATGRGQHVEATLVANLTPYDILDGARHALNAPSGESVPRSSIGPPADLTAPFSLAYLTSRTADGRWIQWANMAPHLFWAEAELLGFGDRYGDPSYTAMPNGGTDEVRMSVWDAVLAATSAVTAEDLMDRVIAGGKVGAEIMRTTQEGMDHPQARYNGDVVSVYEADGSQSEQIGPLAQFSRTPSVIPARPGMTGVWPPPKSGEVSSNGPLSGITIVEAAAMYAAPYGPSVLADYGARVIKLEPLSGDPMGAYYGDGPAKVMYGKERVAIDLKQPEAQDVVRRLIRRVDAFIHNYRPGVPERLGIDEASLRLINPELIYLYAGAYGADGPYSALPAYHPSAGAICGNAVLQAGGGTPPQVDLALSEDETKQVSSRLSRANEGNPDPNSAMVVATALLLALVGRERHGVGQAVQTSMLGANAYAMSDDWIRYDGKPQRLEPDSDLNGLGPAYRLYETASGWIFLACTNQAEWDRFVATTAASPKEPDATALADLFRTRSAADWERDLLSAGVACVRADGPGYGWFLRDDPQAAASELLSEVEHPISGSHRRQSPMATLSLTPGRARSSEPLGFSTRRVLMELGYDDGDVERLVDRQVVRLA
jgi:crotonobetainyl-CoA:carnitine CoA-transferase CaiB-like acyl-CoA transferase